METLLEKRNPQKSQHITVETLLDKQIPERSQHVIETLLDKQSLENVQIEGPHKADDSPQTTNCRILTQVGAVYAAFLAQGMIVAVEGPALPDLQVLYSTSTTNISLGFTLNSVGLFLGAVICGWTFTKLQYEIQLAGAILTSGFFTIIEPFSNNITGFICVMFLKGLSLGFMSTGVCFYIIQCLHKHRLQGSAVQGLYTAWCVGASLSPLIVQGFVSSRSHDKGSTHVNHTVSNHTHPSSNLTYIFFWNASIQTEICKSCAHQKSQNVAVAFLIVGGICLLLTLPLILIAWKNRKSCSHEQVKENLKFQDKSPRGHLSKVAYFFLLVLLCLYCICYLANELIIGSYLTTWAVQSLSWTTRKGALLMTAFWVPYSINRLIGIPLAAICSPRHMSYVGITAIFASFLILTVFYSKNNMVIWVCAAGVGAGLSWPYAAMLTWLAGHITISNRVSALIQCANAVGRLVSPIVTGYLMEQHHPDWMLYLGTGTAAFIILIYICMEILIILQPKRPQMETK